MRTTPIILDRMEAALVRHGVKLRRSQLLETAAAAFGYHNQGEFSAAAKRGDLDAAPVDVLGRVETCDTALIVVRDTGGGVYGIEESFVEQVVEDERRERFGPSPYGGLVDLSDVAAHPATAWKAADAAPGRYVVLDGELTEAGAHEDLDEAKRAVDIEEDVSVGMIVDVAEGRALHYQWGWRDVPVGGRDRAEIVTRAALAVTRARLERSRERHEQTLRLDVPDWRAWEKDLKRASHKGQEPLSDELLHQFRHSVADVHCKSSASQRSEVELRQRRYVEKHLGALLARLDRAEEALREAGLAPAEIARKSKDDAAETLAAIEAVRPRQAGRTIPNLYEVEATRDGDKCHEFYTADGYDHWEDKGREIACRQFRMGDLEDYRDEDGGFDDFDAECDTFEVREVDYPEAASIISDALAELSVGGNFQFGIPHSHPARIKLVAAREMLIPKATATA